MDAQSFLLGAVTVWLLRPLIRFYVVVVWDTLVDNPPRAEAFCWRDLIWFWPFLEGQS